MGKGDGPGGGTGGPAGREQVGLFIEEGQLVSSSCVMLGGDPELLWAPDGTPAWRLEEPPGVPCSALPMGLPGRDAQGALLLSA